MFHPFGNDTACPPAAWHPEPNIRGTANILLSCLSTITLCIWTVIHLNLPEHKKGHLQKWRKCGWLIMGLLAPEIVAWNAWEQRRQVTRLTRKMDDLKQRRFHAPMRKPTTLKDKVMKSWQAANPSAWLTHWWHRIRSVLLLEAKELNATQEKEAVGLDASADAISEWTELHSWYAIMGGYVFDTSSAERPFLPGGLERLSLTPYGLVFLALERPHLIPRMSKQDIADKSKSDGLAKFLTCWQATWFCVQCIYRISQGFSVSLLELNVFGHALCALLIFTIWWDKPKDIVEPTKLIGGESDSVVAMLCSLSSIGVIRGPSLIDTVISLSKYAFRGLLRLSGRPVALETNVPKFNHLQYSQQMFTWIPSQSCEPHQRLLRSLPIGIYPVEELIKARCLRIGRRTWTLGSCHRWAFAIQHPRSCSQCFLPGPPLLLKGPFNVEIDQYIITRLDRIDSGLLRTARLVKHDDPIFENILSGDESMVQTRSPDWSLRPDNLNSVTKWDFWVQWGGMLFATALYRGLHAGAWDISFPTPVQQSLWRISSAAVALSLSAITIPIWVTSTVWTKLYSIREHLWQRVRDGEKELKRKTELFDRFRNGLGYIVLGVVLLLGIPLLLAYVAARCYLIVGCFISLAHLPPSALAVPNWPQYIPHIT